MALPPEPPDEQPPPPPSAVDAEGGDCPRCGTPYEPFQEYCLECGLRLPVSRGLIPVLATAWRRRVPWYPGDWIWPVLLALVIAALAAGFAILVTTGGSPTKTQAATDETVPGSTETGPPPTPTEPTGTSPVPTTPTTTETETEPTPTEPAPPPPAAGGLTEWPAGQNGWTIVLVSSPQSSGRAAAVTEANKAISAGLSEVGVLNSSEYSSLHSGYFVVFSGVYNSETEATRALDTPKASYPQAYVRQITR